MVSTAKASFSIAVAACLQGQCEAFVPPALDLAKQQNTLIEGPTHVGHFASLVTTSEAESTSSSPSISLDTPFEPNCHNRRKVVAISLSAACGVFNGFDRPVALAAGGTLDETLSKIKEARDQLENIPDLIKEEKWDAVRAILIKAPLSNMWTSGGQNKLLNNYADAIGNELPDGDEIAALELREELISHLRYLDMAVYNNVFNPIATEGQSGATKELIRSYYEDPINEWKASKAAMDELIGLASP